MINYINLYVLNVIENNILHCHCWFWLTIHSLFATNLYLDVYAVGRRE